MMHWFRKYDVTPLRSAMMQTSFKKTHLCRKTKVRFLLKTNPNFNTNAPPFEVRGCIFSLGGAIFIVQTALLLLVVFRNASDYASRYQRNADNNVTSMDCLILQLRIVAKHLR